MTSLVQQQSHEGVVYISRLSLLLLLLVLVARSSLPAQEGCAKQGGPLDGLFLLKDSKTSRISSYDRGGANHDWITIAPGETQTLFDISGTGAIRRFYVTTIAPDRMRYRKLVLRMYWDGEKEPSVEVPLGDFFGAGLGPLRYFRSLVVNLNLGLRGWDFDGLVSYFPMPFHKAARVTLENDGKVPDFRLWYHIDFEQYPEGALPSNAGTFHAQWRRVARTPVRAGIPQNTTSGNDEAQHTTGEDNYVILGDDMICVDGAKSPPTYPGTGHEEVFNAGCSPDAEFWGPYTGFYLIENLNGNFGGKNQMYRF